MLNPANLRMTRQRLVLLEELRKVNTHPSADEIYGMVRKRLPRISLGTIYRNLEILSDLGEIRRLDTGSHLKRFDGRADNHYHIRCLHCDRLEDAVFSLEVDLDDCLKGATDFTILGYQLEFLGICPRCQNPPVHASEASTNDPPPGAGAHPAAAVPVDKSPAAI